jgi:hypothetical protein
MRRGSIPKQAGSNGRWSSPSFVRFSVLNAVLLRRINLNQFQPHSNAMRIHCLKDPRLCTTRRYVSRVFDPDSAPNNGFPVGPGLGLFELRREPKERGFVGIATGKLHSNRQPILTPRKRQRYRELAGEIAGRRKWENTPLPLSHFLRRKSDRIDVTELRRSRPHHSREKDVEILKRSDNLAAQNAQRAA